MTSFKVEILSFSAINELPKSWSDEDYKALLAKMDYENPEEIETSELKAMCLMSITDFEPSEAAEIVLSYLLSDELTVGQIGNLSHQMLTEKLWEEYPKLNLHPAFFKATQLLHEAYNGKFPRTEAVQLQAKVSGGSLSLFDENPEAPLLRLISAGMSDRSLVNRLFSDQIEGNTFEEAADILWQLSIVEKDADSIVFDIVSSAYWLEDIKYADTFEAATHADVIIEEED